MEALSVGGLASGLDTNAIIDGLTDLEMVRVRRAESKQLKVEDKLESFDKLKTRLGDFANTADSLTKVESFNVFSSTSSDEESVTVDGNEDAVPGSYEIEVQSLATKLKTTSKGFNTTVTAFGFAGTFEVSKSAAAIKEDPTKTTTSISVSATDTLKDLVNKINGTDGIGVQASILSLSSNDYRLVLSAVDSGSKGFTMKDTGGSNILDAGGLDILDYNQTVRSDFNFKLATIGAADSSTLMTDVFSSIGTNTAIDGGDEITINGLDANGNAVSGTYTYTPGDTLNDLLTTVKSVYESMGASVNVSLNSSGEIVINDLTGGVNEMEMNLAFNDANASGSQMSLTPSGKNGLVQSHFKNVLSEGRKAFFRVDGLSVSSNSNESDSVITGTNFKLHKAELGKTVEVNLERDTSGIKAKIQTFLDGYNGIIAYINEQSKVNIEDAKNPGDKAKVTSKGAFASDSSIQRIKADLRSLVTNSIPELAEKSSYTSLASIGITSSTSDGTLAIDEERFNKAINNDFEAVRRLFVVSGYSDNAEHKFGKADVTTESGVYQVDADGDLMDKDKSSAGTLMVGANRQGSLLSGLDGPSKGLHIVAELGTGTGNMTFIRGIAGGIAKYWKEVTDREDGYLVQTRESITRRIDSFKDQVENLTEKADRFRQNLVKQFANLETSMSRLQSQSATFQAQIGSLG